MKKFQVTNIENPNDNPFDRQERIEWWDQEKLKNAKVMVVGAGAIGNETLKNLALLGVGNIFIVDFDDIETSNLSRTVLFRKSDKGKLKAETAAERTREMSPLEDVKIDYHHGDVVWDLGTGLFRDMDLVLGCLDNVETRFAVNKQCRLVGVPWIDAGIFELGLRVNFYHGSAFPCYQCAASPKEMAAARKRYSCDDFKKTVISEGKIPTVQIASAIVSGLQVQEAVKYLSGQDVSFGKQIYFQGKNNDFDVFGTASKKECREENCCAFLGTYDKITNLDFSASQTLREFLEKVSGDSLSGEGASLDLRGDRTFVKSASCRCGTNLIPFMRPTFRIYDYETICDGCIEGESEVAGSDLEVNKETLGQFSLSVTEGEILDMSLYEIGIPHWHIVSVRDDEGNYCYYELSADRSKVLPNISGG